MFKLFYVNLIVGSLVEVDRSAVTIVLSACAYFTRVACGHYDYSEKTVQMANGKSP